MTKKTDAALTHVDRDGRVAMVDVGAKPATDREASASAEVHMSPAAVRAIRTGAVKKGDPLQAARIAGIMAAKQTSSLIPLCHPLPISHVQVELQPRRWGYRVVASVRTHAPTGVEMEALTAASVAALTIYDMLKAVDRTMVVTNVMVQHKRGGRSGEYRRLPANGRAARR